STSARITVAASSWAGTSFSEPPNPPTGVRSGSQITASRIEKASSHVLPGEPLGDERGTLRSLDLDRHLRGQLHPARDVCDVGELDVRPYLAADGNGRGEPHPVEPVVDAHLRALDAVDLLHEVRQQRQ